ncbi:MAG TPA: hypothetical protein VFC46_09400, partial [Humisphaera sp.]|nr:hypothetical protein [Humisphaera sp.]
GHRAEARRHEKFPSSPRTILSALHESVRSADPTRIAHGYLAAYPDARLVVNKCDKPWAWDVSRLAAIQTTATTGAGVDTLRHAVASHFGCGDIEMSQPRWWTPRQREILRRTAAEQVGPA